MNETLKSISYERSLSLDRFDIFENSAKVYPESYREFQRSIENIFFKSELLLKCKLEFERLITVDLPEALANTELINKNLNLPLIFTGATKSGRSSLINMLLNTKVMPTNIIGSSCCVTVTHPKSGAKRISVGVHDLEGWEVDKYMDLEIADLPKKIESLQYSLANKPCDKTGKSSKRIIVQLPHWLLKNINIYECPPIDGVYSFDEPFDLIGKSQNPILIHVIDASNGLMQWDKTFLAKIQHNWPHLAIFFVINHVDIQESTILRDNCLRFESMASDKVKYEFIESESSDHNSTDETTSEKFFASGVLNENLVMKQQLYLIEKCKKQLNKLGFMLENEMTTRYAALSVKEFIKIFSAKDQDRNTYWHFVDKFFSKFNDYLSTWLENLLITSSLELKSRINGVVDSARCQIIYASEILQDLSSDTYLQDIKKAENKIKDEFLDIQNDFDRLVAKSVKEQLKKNESSINKSLPDLTTDDNSQIIHIIKPKLLDSFENILFGSIHQYNLNEEIIKILNGLYKHLETVFIKLYKPNKTLSFFEYILNLFRTLKRTMVYPLISRLPDEIIQCENKWYKELLKNAARKIRGSQIGHQSLVVELINDIKVTPIIKTTQIALGNIHKQIHIFTKKYQETYKIARTWTFQKTDNGPDIFKKLLLVDFVIKVIEKSFQKQKSNVIMDNFTKFPTFYYEFYDYENYMIKCINIQSFTSLSDEINILSVKRICRSNQYIMTHKSTKLCENGLCMLYYSKMDYDLYIAMQNGTKWQTSDVICIIRSLLYAAKCLLAYSQYLLIEFVPENIMLKVDSKKNHECKFFPFISETSSIAQISPSKIKSQGHLSDVIYQIGTVLCWLLTNDMYVCLTLNEDKECQVSELTTQISDKTLDSLKQSNMIKMAMNFLFKSDSYGNIDSVIKELDSL